MMIEDGIEVVEYKIQVDKEKVLEWYVVNEHPISLKKLGYYLINDWFNFFNCEYPSSDERVLRRMYFKIRYKEQV